MLRIFGASALLIAVWPGAVPAQAAEPEAGIFACPQVEDEHDRLACFDREIEDLAARLRQGAPALAGVEEAPSGAGDSDPNQPGAVKLAEDAFGEEDLEQSVSERRAEQEARGELSELKAAVIESGENPYGKVFLVLDNGQVWRQLDSDDTMLRIPRGVDATVTIKRSIFGSYMLTVDQLRRTIRAKRIK